MSSRPQTGSRRGASRQYSKSAHEKKAKEKKQRSGAKKNLIEEAPEVSAKEVAEKTVSSLNKLGNQIFALSPFSQYYDDWLVNLRQVVSEFESSPQIKVDEQFTQERSQIFAGIQEKLAEKRIQESTLTGAAKELYDNNHLLGDLDAEYANKTRELSIKRNSDVQRLTTKVNNLEGQLEEEKENRDRIFNPIKRRRLSQKINQTQSEITAAKNELEVTLQNFRLEQEKLHDDYEKRKHDITVKIEALQKEVDKLETDTSKEDRQTACSSLADSVTALYQRITAGKIETQ